MQIEIDNKMYDVKFTVNAVCALEEVTGKLLGQIMQQKGYTGVRNLLWCGIHESEPGITQKQVGVLLEKYLEDKTLEDLIDVIGEAIEQAGFLKAKGLIKKK